MKKARGATNLSRVSDKALIAAFHGAGPALAPVDGRAKEHTAARMQHEHNQSAKAVPPPALSCSTTRSIIISCPGQARAPHQFSRHTSNSSSDSVGDQTSELRFTYV